MTSKLRPTFADYIVTALSPTLIMGLIGSLVFFLVEILYAGKYEGRLLWTFFFFVIGIVLVARIAIETDAARATMYGLGLSVVSWIALQAFIEFPNDSTMAKFSGVINLFLMGVIWWCAHKLTWNCTFIDEQRPVSGKGLLSAAGFEQRPDTLGQIRDEDVRAEIEKLERLPFAKRWQRFRDRRKKRPHTPGLTVVWFSLAALPIFGLGQSLIPANEHGRRSFTFWLAACYVGCALGLLLTTSFLGLRRYLRQRKLQMPNALTGIWLGLGGVLVVVFLLVGALLPRPYSETPIADIGRAASKDRSASKNAIVKDSTGKGDSNSGGENKPKDGEGKAKDGQSKGGEKSDQGKPVPGDKKDGKDGEGKDGQSGSGDKKDGQGGKEKKSGQGSEPKQGKDGQNEPSPDRPNPDSSIGRAVTALLGFLKWLVFILLALLVLAFLVRGGLQYLANFMPGPKKWLAALSAWWERLWRKRLKIEKPSAPAADKKPERRPFTSFSNPFADGTSEGRSVEELIGYTFAALEAWAADRDHGRRPDETALEFASRLTNTFHSLEGDAQKLAILVVRLAYANGKLPADARETLDQVWDRLTSTMPAAAVAE